MKLTSSKNFQAELERMNLTTFEDVVEYLPRTYLNLNLSRETSLEDKEKIVIQGQLVSTPTIVKHGNLTIVRFSFITINSNFFNIVAFNRPYLLNQLKLGETYTIMGNYDLAKRVVNLVKLVNGEVQEKDKLQPVYSLPSSIQNYQMIRLVQKAFEQPLRLEDYVPISLKDKYQLLSKKEALRMVHFPSVKSDVYKGLRTLKYEECLLFTLKTQWIRKQNKAIFYDRKKPIPLESINEFVKNLPYKLTGDQLKAVREIILDMNNPTLMYRLMQGDVGTGKTLVSAIALFGNYKRGDQGALMAPTDALARQHYRYFSDLFKDTGIKIALLVGALTQKEKNDIKIALKNKEIDLIIGTHALFSDDVTFASLGLAVIDEQHRFGVNQRSMLSNKGERADLLLMSATPIPRTLALTIYGDLDITTIEEFPFAKRNVTTKVISKDSELIHYQIEESLKENRRVYVIAPLIEGKDENDHNSVLELFKEYENRYLGRVSLLHGKMTYEEKEASLMAFKEGKTPILISTTVVEVGIDVKEASLMIIYSANRFGLASLHQLRGRIGRDSYPSLCLLLADNDDEQEIEKIQVLEHSEDGFYIAEEDLKRRGPGELIGIKQSGLPDFRYVNFISDFKIIEVARNDASMILANPNFSEYQAILRKMKKDLEEEFNPLN